MHKRIKVLFFSFSLEYEMPRASCRSLRSTDGPWNFLSQWKRKNTYTSILKFSVKTKGTRQNPGNCHSNSCKPGLQIFQVWPDARERMSMSCFHTIVVQQLNGNSFNQVTDSINIYVSMYVCLSLICCCIYELRCKIHKNWCTVTVAPTIEHHGGHSRTPANQRWDQVPGRSQRLLLG